MFVSQKSQATDVEKPARFLVVTVSVLCHVCPLLAILIVVGAGHSTIIGLTTSVIAMTSNFSLVIAVTSKSSPTHTEFSFT